MLPLEIPPDTVCAQCLHSARLKEETSAAPLAHSQDWRNWIHMSLVVCLFLTTEIVLYLNPITLPFQKNWGLLFHLSTLKRLWILCCPESKTEDKMWWRYLFPAIWDLWIICLRSNSSSFPSFPSVKGWLEPGLLQFYGGCHRWASFFLLSDLGGKDSTEKWSRGLFLHT